MAGALLWAAQGIVGVYSVWLVHMSLRAGVDTRTPVSQFPA